MHSALSCDKSRLSGIFCNEPLEDSMGRSLCIIHANCQGDSLHALLASTPRFAQYFEIKKITNYLREHVSSGDFTRCALFLYQELGAKWEEHSASRLLAELPGSAAALKLPNMFFNGYWPLWTNRTHMAFGDMLLEHLAERGCTLEEMLHVCLRGRLAAKYDLAALVGASLEKEESKEQGQIVRTVPLVREFWRTEQLFHTVNHPGSRLLLHVADGVLDALELGRVPLRVRAAFAAQQEEFEQPIHPQVGTFFDLPFALPTRRYRVYGQMMNYAQYAAAYADCRLRNEEGLQDFAAYLHLLASKTGSTRAA